MSSSASKFTSPLISEIKNRVDSENTKIHSLNMYGKFVTYATVLSFLMDDFTFAYQISSTNFEGLVQNKLFRGNMLRLKAVAA